LDDLAGVSDAARTLLALLVSSTARLSSVRAGAVLVYHRVGGAERSDPARQILASIPEDVFAGQLRHLRRHYRVVAAGELLDAVRKRRRGQRFPVAVTFDDDLSSHVRDAAPALQRARVTATFFVGGTSLREPRPFWWEDLQHAVDSRLVTAGAVPHVAEDDLRAALERAPKAIFRVAATIERLAPAQRADAAAALRDAVGSANGESGLRAADVRALVGAGFEVGFHTLHHDALPALSDAELDAALRDGREALESAAGRKLALISYPYGKADQRVAAAAASAGFRLGFTTKRGPVTPETVPLLVPRIAPAPSVGKTVLRVARAVAPWS
jgi:peptidoglycan/xylan/chitin deacetylase (PgdA/CDA1 family)